jgi:hypothetical protein
VSLARLGVLVVLLTVLAPAHASTVTVVATGDTDLQATLAYQVEGWLRGHGHAIGAPLSAEATSSLLNCMVMDDQGCARGVVEAQAKAEAVLVAQALKSRTNDATVLTITWFIKSKEPIGMRRACEECTAGLMRSTVEEMLGTVIGVSKLERGRLSLKSTPSGLTVLLDNENVGVTPLEREVPAGQHKIVLVHRGQPVGERVLKIHPEVTAEITIAATMPPVESGEPAAPSRSFIGPGIALGLGTAALATGIVLYVTSEVDDGTKPTYRDTKPAGIGFAAGGVAVLAIGAWLFLSDGGSKDSAPVASVTSEGGMLGWSRAF